jgi:hypothetical protein
LGQHRQLNDRTAANMATHNAWRSIVGTRWNAVPRSISDYWDFGVAPFGRLRSLTPGPPPFSSMNLAPPASNAASIRARASSDTRGPAPASTRFTVGRESPARLASSD